MYTSHIIVFVMSVMSVSSCFNILILYTYCFTILSLQHEITIISCYIILTINFTQPTSSFLWVFIRLSCQCFQSSYVIFCCPIICLCVILFRLYIDIQSPMCEDIPYGILFVMLPKVVQYILMFSNSSHF